MSVRDDLLIRTAPLPRPNPGESSPAWVLAPWLTALPVQGRDLLALLPVLDVNTLSFAALRALPAGSEPQAIAALFCADPFLRVRDAVQILRAAGIRRVTNFPTIQIIDGTAAHGFDSAGLGVQREADVLGECVRAGFEVTGFCTSAEAGALLARQGVTALVLHPGPAATDWRMRAAAGHEAAGALRSLRHLTDLPVRLMWPDGYGPELDAALALADGRVRYA
ncbi:phosphoenolpyruvate hydrolase family protein [Pseudotabrizicola sp. 4114]|uniref:phosphoenolpyruvate hydrolase family protein n=1 Tax=Pseudotabrizicola sp. 4114 TaxID=2817731 RepID=UPI00285C4FD2|nr:putative TIM-barrel enzyme [Pseudorhodobacter sp. 4114]